MLRHFRKEPLRPGKQQTLFPMSFCNICLSLQSAWFLKARALTEQTYVDEVEMEEEGIAELFMEDTAIADVASKSNYVHINLNQVHVHVCIDDHYRFSAVPLGPGTSLRKPPGTASHGTSQGIRPLSQSGRPLSGFIRPGTQGSRPKTMEQAIMTPRTAMTAR